MTGVAAGPESTPRPYFYEWASASGQWGRGIMWAYTLKDVVDSLRDQHGIGYGGGIVRAEAFLGPVDASADPVLGSRDTAWSRQRALLESGVAPKWGVW